MGSEVSDSGATHCMEVGNASSGRKVGKLRHC